MVSINICEEKLDIGGNKNVTEPKGTRFGRETNICLAGLFSRRDKWGLQTKATSSGRARPTLPAELTPEGNPTR